MLAMVLILAAGIPAVGGPPSIKTSHIQPRVSFGMEIQTDKDKVTVLPGVCRIGNAIVKVSKATALTIAPPTTVAIDDEKYVLSDDAPDRWMGGTHLKSFSWTPGGTVLPGCLVPGTVNVGLPDGTGLREGRDYKLDTTWAGIWRLQNGAIGPDTQVTISYRVGMQRIDGIDVTPEGQVQIIPGIESKTAPLPPPVTPGGLRIANIYMPAGSTTVALWQIYVVGDPFAEPEENIVAQRASLVEKTLRKLRKGGPVTIVTWGDSATAGGDASSPDHAFPRLFASRLGERFKKAQIKLVNAGVGGTNSSARLGQIATEVLSSQPDLVTVEFLNDMELPPEKERKNMESAIEAIRGAGAEALIITPNFVMPSMMGLEHPRGPDGRRNVAVLRDVAAAASVGLADVAKRWEYLEREGLPYVTLLENGINHPDDRGHELYVDELMTFFPASDQP